MKRNSKLFTIASSIIAVLVVLGMVAMSSGLLGMIFSPEPQLEGYSLLRIVGTLP